MLAWSRSLCVIDSRARNRSARPNSISAWSNLAFAAFSADIAWSILDFRSALSRTTSISPCFTSCPALTRTSSTLARIFEATTASYTGRMVPTADSCRGRRNCFTTPKARSPGTAGSRTVPPDCRAFTFGSNAPARTIIRANDPHAEERRECQAEKGPSSSVRYLGFALGHCGPPS